MPINFLCVDDEGETSLAPFLKVIEQAGDDIKIELIPPSSDLDSLIKQIQSKNPAGLILDLRLDPMVNYRGSTLAQELRTRMVEKNISSIPIVLWSVDDKLQKTFNRDDTAQDLFDCIYIKDEMVLKNPLQVAHELSSLVNGYNRIQGAINNDKSLLPFLLDLSAEEADSLDPRVGDIFTENDKSVHEYARYILQEIVLTQGPLIDEKVLAARLGIDLETSPSWNQVKENLENECSYRGVFNEAWPRWWAIKVDNWWSSLPDSPGTLRRIGASERVDFLSKIIKDDNLTAATTIDEGYSERYWTICSALQKPLDPIDGFLAASHDLKPWQDSPYLSIKAALERVGKDRGIRVHSLERERLAEINPQKS